MGQNSGLLSSLTDWNSTLAGYADSISTGVVMPVALTLLALFMILELYNATQRIAMNGSNNAFTIQQIALVMLKIVVCRWAVVHAENRYQFSCEQNELSTETGADFHLTVTDTASPDREMNTPSRDQNSTVQAANSFNNRNTDAPQQSTSVPEIVSQPVKQQEKQLDLLFLLLDFMPVVLVGAVLFVVRRKHRR
mgnify:CR=1 FL=1